MGILWYTIYMFCSFLACAVLFVCRCCPHPSIYVDLVLGVQWLRTLGPILLDFLNLRMEFNVAGCKHVLRGVTKSSCKVIKGSSLNKEMLQNHQIALLHFARVLGLWLAVVCGRERKLYPCSSFICCAPRIEWNSTRILTVVPQENFKLVPMFIWNSSLTSNCHWSIERRTNYHQSSMVHLELLITLVTWRTSWNFSPQLPFMMCFMSVN